VKRPDYTPGNREWQSKKVKNEQAWPFKSGSASRIFKMSARAKAGADKPICSHVVGRSRLDIRGGMA
jgi:hypothetical protein